MRLFPILLLTALPVSAQPADTLQMLLNEVRELRVAIERSTLLGARTQLAIIQLQLNEASVARIEQQLYAVRAQEPGPARLARGAEQVKQLEEAMADPQNSAPPRRAELESALRQLKMDMEQATALEQQRSARESELAIQLQAAQAQVADSRGRIATMEQALDAALQQIPKPR